MSKKNLNFLHLKTAFTLAEVLITLGIIGIIAEMTIPVLMQNTQNAELKVGAKEAYSKMSQVVQTMLADNNGDISSYVQATRSFEPVFEKYFKVTNDCGMGSTCNNSYKNLNRGTVYVGYFDDGSFVTADGMAYMINNCYTPATAYDEKNTTGCSPFVEISVDVNGLKAPNTVGRDVFMFQLSDNGKLAPMGGENSEFPASKYCQKNDSIYQGFGCMYNIMQGITY